MADFRGVATVSPLVTAVVGHGSTTAISMGPTSSVSANDLVIGADDHLWPAWQHLAGTGQGVPYVVDVADGSVSSSLEEVLASAAGRARGDARLSLTSYQVVSVQQELTRTPGTAGDGPPARAVP